MYNSRVASQGVLTKDNTEPECEDFRVLAPLEGLAAPLDLTVNFLKEGIMIQHSQYV